MGSKAVSLVEQVRGDPLRNSHSLMPSLPVEILQELFLQCAKYCFYFHQPRHPSIVPYWVNISYVCRYWRNAALKCPTLWTYLFVTSRRWTEELLHRSKQAPLKVYIDFRYALRHFRSLQNLKKVMDHIERIEELRLIELPHEHDVLSKLYSPAPRLRFLISTASSHSRLSQPLRISGDTPALCTLELSHCPVLLDSFGLNALTSLRLNDVQPEFRQNMKDFLCTLRRMQNLTDLHLRFAFHPQTGFPSSATLTAFEKVDLCHLSRLFLHAPSSTVVAFLSCVNIPLDANVWLALSYTRSEGWDPYDLLCPLIAQRYSVAEDLKQLSPTIRSFALDAPYKLTCSPNGHTFTAASTDAWDSDFLFQIELPSSEPDIHNIVVDVCHSLPLSDVQSFYVSEPSFDGILWRKMLGCLPSLQHLQVSKGWMPDFSTFAVNTTPFDGAEVQDRNGSVPSRRAIAPLLRWLKFEGTVFYPPPYNTCHAPAFPVTRDALFDALSKRQGSRGRLAMTNCQMDNQSVDLVMEWDDGVVRLVKQLVYAKAKRGRTVKG